MLTQGPLLETLTRRLAETPPEFLAEPRMGAAGVVHVDAVISDLLRELGGPPLTASQAQAFRPPASAAKKRRRPLRLALLAAWLLFDPWFQGKDLANAARAFFISEELEQMALSVDAPRVVADGDRREELVRLCLRALGLRPAGESEAQAHDRLLTISTAERERVIKAARAAEERAREIREAMARKAAEEAADKWTRE